MQPSLGSIRPVRVLADYCLKLSYPVFSGPELSGYLMGHRESLLVLCLGISGCPMEQPQMPGLPGQWDRQLPA